MNPATKFLNALLHFSFIHFCTSLDTITINQPLLDGETIVSNGDFYALGFFTPGSSVNRYLGIWYNKISERTVVWVANRDNPITDKSGFLKINTHGNLALHRKNQTSPLWSTQIQSLSANDSKAQILDSGNLVLVHKGKIVWQSFDYPTNTMLPNLKLGIDKRTGLNRFLTSWKSPDDPGTGNFSYRINPEGVPQLGMYEDEVPRWRTGFWNGMRWSGLPIMQDRFIFTASYIENEEEISISWGVLNSSIMTRLVVDQSGLIQRFTWHEDEGKWNEFWFAPSDQCDNYGQCGVNGNCNMYNNDVFYCTCLPSFEPKSPNEWYLRDGSSGCIRTRNRTGICQTGEGFVEVPNVKLPDTAAARAVKNLELKDCEKLCLENCSCIAHAILDVKKGSRCLMWFGDLLDTRVFIAGGQSLYLRVDADVLAQYGHKANKGLLAKRRIILPIVMPIAAAIFIIVVLSSCLVKRRNKSKHGQLQLSISDSSPLGHPLEKEKELDRETRTPYLSIFGIDILVTATQNFSNKLGEGGFGAVYKGELPNGQEIAVKRLSKKSGQGLQEFKNEVSLISKLQHRNLVKLFGCCIDREDKMLIYEYLPNKSLDYFIFDETRKSLLDWRKRFEIISGITRGILYLHQDSRLKIIHRDLKAGNVLLDANLDPKISDFGMAKMFGDNQVEANTKRVVGTFGYMSPEYAMDGIYSIKSDVFSYGVLILEIISGRKNTQYDEGSQYLNLIGHVWDLWREGKAIEIVDPVMEKYSINEILRCIQIGLLCVQESAVDRPTMREVLFMLRNETNLPSPQKPAYIFRTQSERDSFAASINQVTITVLDAR